MLITRLASTYTKLDGHIYHWYPVIIIMQMYIISPLHNVLVVVVCTKTIIFYKYTSAHWAIKT